jgi:putative flippase GtrA
MKVVKGMKDMKEVLERFARFNAVGALGVGVQLTTLWVLVELWGAGYVLATAIAVGCAVVHNFVWHQCWTWGDRRTHGAAAALTFLRFAGANGLISMAGNLAVMALLAGGAGVHPVIANAIAIGFTGLVNFATSHLLVFARASSAMLDVPLQSGERAVPFARD